MKFLKPIILLLALFAFVDSQILPVPEQDIQLVEGFLNSTHLLNSIGLANCQDDLELIISGVQNISFENKGEMFSEFAQLFTAASNIYQNCPEFESKVFAALEFANKAYHFPGKFIDEGLNELIAFSMIKKLYYLKGDLKKEDLTQAGKILGEILNMFLNSKFSKKDGLVFLADDSKSNDACMDILQQIQVDVKTMMSNLFSDMSKVKSALDDFFVQLKNIPSACI